MPARSYETPRSETKDFITGNVITRVPVWYSYQRPMPSPRLQGDNAGGPKMHLSMQSCVPGEELGARVIRRFYSKWRQTCSLCFLSGRVTSCLKVVRYTCSREQGPGFTAFTAHTGRPCGDGQGAEPIASPNTKRGPPSHRSREEGEEKRGLLFQYLSLLGNGDAVP